MTGVLLTAIVVSWNERDDLRRCLTSLRDHPAGPQQVVVVDNGSEDGTAEMVRTHHPEAELLLNDRNRGLSAARNQAMRTARGRYIAVLDSDTVVTPEALSLLCKELELRPSVGMIGPRLVYPDGSLQLSCRRIPSPLALIANRLTGIDALARNRARRRHLMMDEPHDRPMEVDYMLGATLVFRRAVPARIGGFDQRMPYGFEDADWALRIRKAGWGVLYLPEATVIHRYRRRTVEQPFSWQSASLLLSYGLLRVKHPRPARAPS